VRFHGAMERLRQQFRACPAMMPSELLNAIEYALREWDQPPSERAKEWREAVNQVACATVEHRDRSTWANHPKLCSLLDEAERAITHLGAAVPLPVSVLALQEENAKLRRVWDECERECARMRMHGLGSEPENERQRLEAIAWNALGRPGGTHELTNVERLAAEVERLRGMQAGAAGDQGEVERLRQTAEELHSEVDNMNRRAILDGQRIADLQFHARRTIDKLMDRLAAKGADK